LTAGARLARHPLAAVVARQQGCTYRVKRCIPGIISLILSMLIVVYLLRADWQQNLTGLLVEGAGVFAESFLIIIVIDQLAQYRERQRWKSLHSNMGQTLQRAFVDLMRVNYIFMHPQSADSLRLSEFIDFARFSLSDLRSQIESFTDSLDSEAQSQIRSIEKKLNYLFRNFYSLSLKSRSDYISLNSVNYENYIFFQSNDNWRVFIELSNSVERFLAKISFRRDATEEATAKGAVAEATAKVSDASVKYERFYEIRFDAQQIAIDKTGLKYVLLDDTDQTNSLYFSIDRLLLEKIVARASP
jgi:hypothetical protein